MFIDLDVRRTKPEERLEHNGELKQCKLATHQGR